MWVCFSCLSLSAHGYLHLLWCLILPPLSGYLHLLRCLILVPHIATPESHETSGAGEFLWCGLEEYRAPSPVAVRIIMVLTSVSFACVMIITINTAGLTLCPPLFLSFIDHIGGSLTLPFFVLVGVSLSLFSEVLHSQWPSTVFLEILVINVVHFSHSCHAR